MLNSELFQDWFFRYQHLLKKRYTKNQKKRFLNSLATDLTAIRPDISLRKDKLDKDSLHLVVGDLKKAKTVVATYYDTPAIYKGDYFYFDLKKQKNATTLPIVLLGGLMLVLGILVTIFFTMPFLNQPFSWKTVLIVVAYVVYFLFFGKLTRGWPSGKTGIRNTSSVLFLLNYIQETPESQMAFVFYDNGVQGGTSVKKIIKKLNLEQQRLIVLDSIGAAGKLLRLVSKKQKVMPSEITTQQSDEVANRNEMFLVATDASATDQHLYLSKDAMNTSTLNEENFHVLKDYLRNLERSRKK